MFFFKKKVLNKEIFLNASMNICFKSINVSSRKDLVSFLEENFSKEIYKKIGCNHERWIEELDILSNFIEKKSISKISGIYSPPIDDSEFREIGENVYFYRGQESKLRGIWTREFVDYFDLKTMNNEPREKWNHYKIGSTAKVFKNIEYDMDINSLLPDNFEPISEIVKNDKRPIFKFENEGINIYAKGSQICTSRFLSAPSYRLTNIGQIVKMSSYSDLEKYVKLSGLKVSVPKIIGYYESILEDFLFVEEVKGKEPQHFFNNHRNEIIVQDAMMLAKLCLLGYEKTGFNDFDDKIFDGKNLYLIDVDEVFNLYDNKDFRELIINPLDTRLLEGFRIEQISKFKHNLKDALFNYSNKNEKLLTNENETKLYINTFFNIMNWQAPSDSEITELTDFENYITQDDFRAMCMD